MGETVTQRRVYTVQHCGAFATIAWQAEHPQVCVLLGEPGQCLSRAVIAAVYDYPDWRPMRQSGRHRFEYPGPWVVAWNQDKVRSGARRHGQTQSGPGGCRDLSHPFWRESASWARK